ncbi:MMPL family transporter [Aeromicrobium tamlense]|uniref:MMPL family transporter n=1 Tax=Aeromicrobium tamlense TaxID=375541 RepID=A0A8I0KH29_9ACTN|nr:MMPL family transporter [Aeromicrobium tamlense]MBD1269015.1 MMPL family transporter [Aeromicrobium tamlense]NYI37077.1 RND superfamily putative drug exporter [Aeromicrobium tamlense]
MNRQVAGWITHRWVKWVVLALMLVILGGLGSFGAKLTSVQDNDIASWLPEEAESTQVIEKAGSFYDENTAPAIVLLTSDAPLTPADLAAGQQAAQAIGALEDVPVGEVVGPIPSEDGVAAQLIVPITLDDEGWEDLPDFIDEVTDAAEDAVEGTSLRVDVGGPAALGADQAEAFAGIDGILLAAAVGVVVVMLLLTYRSPILWLIPLFCGLMSVFASQGLVYLLAKYGGLTVNGQSAGILSVLVLGAGIDYALLIVARYREELRNYEDRHEAMAHALHRAAPAVFASGSTVIIGLLCLLFAQMNSTAGLGPVGAAGIAVALLAMLVLLPALLVIFGRWVFWPFIPHFGDPQRTSKGFWARVGTWIARAPRVVWVVTSLVLIALSFGIVKLDATGLSNAEAFTTDQPSLAAEERIAEHFPAGAGDPLQIISNAPQAAEVRSVVAGIDGVDAASVTQPQVSGDVAYIEATMTVPSDSTEARDIVETARADLDSVEGADALVGGNTALNLDVQEASAADNRLIIPIILAVVLLVLMMLLRSVAAPLILLLTVVLSFAAAMGISALVFHYVFDFAGADSSFPLFAFVFLVALGIDYNIFLMTRVREESLLHGTRRGALIGLAATGGVITSAGFVLAGTFAALATLPIVFLAELGFAVAIGVLLDTIIVRSVLVTALNLDIGRHIWWPSRLGRDDGAPPDQPPNSSESTAKMPVSAQAPRNQTS